MPRTTKAKGRLSGHLLVTSQRICPSRVDPRKDGVLLPSLVSVFYEIYVTYFWFIGLEHNQFPVLMKMDRGVLPVLGWMHGVMRV